MRPPGARALLPPRPASFHTWHRQTRARAWQGGWIAVATVRAGPAAYKRAAAAAPSARGGRRPRTRPTCPHIGPGEWQRPGGAVGAYPGPRHIQGCVTGLGGRLAESRQDGVPGCIWRGRLKRKGLQRRRGATFRACHAGDGAGPRHGPGATGCADTGRVQGTRGDGCRGSGQDDWASC